MPNVLLAQSNIVCRTLVGRTNFITLDTAFLVPNSVTVNNDSTGDWQVDYEAGTIKFNDSKNYQVCYREFSGIITSPVKNDSLSNIDASVHIPRKIYTVPVQKREELFSTPGIEKNGSISRGISIGNAQNVFVNSNLNLQLHGALAPGVTITGVVSDQNVPIQADGTTQQLQEFDKVYLKIESKKTDVLAGDMVLKPQSGHFLKYNRNVQGGQLFYRFGKDSTFRGSSDLAVSLSKGKFNSHFIDALEGVQGPYKLRGPNNERFVLVLANSEKVFLDGEELKRGWDYDYTIDYNRGEITFNNQIVVTQYSVIRVDFEYSDLNYSRGIVKGDYNHELNNSKLKLSVYRERDNASLPLLFEASQSNIDQLRLIGDDLDQAIISEFDSLAFDPDRVLYKSVKITEDGLDKLIYQYSNSPDSAVYNVYFTEVSTGLGDYNRKDFNRNGAVYEYVGQGQGDFVLGRIVTTPKNKEMLEIGYSQQLRKWTSFVNMAVSNTDENLYSSMDDQDNVGIGVQVGVRSDSIWKGEQWVLKGELVAETVDSSFTGIDRFRDVHFDRDWSADQSIIGGNRLLNSELTLIKDKYNSYYTNLEYRWKLNDMNGWKGQIGMKKLIGDYSLSGYLYQMNSSNSFLASAWGRKLLSIERMKGKLRPGIEFRADENEVVLKSDKTVYSSTMNYRQGAFTLKSDVNPKTKWFSSLSYREDRDTLAGNLAVSAIAYAAQLRLEKRIGNNQLVKVWATWRDVEAKSSSVDPAKNLTGRLDWEAKTKKKEVNSILTITSAKGQELRREFVYIEVPLGQGTHVHRDENSNGVQELDEFIPDDLIGNYVRAFVPGDEYLPVFRNTINWRFDAFFPMQWRTSKGVKKFLSAWSNSTRWKYDQRLNEGQFKERFIPSLGVNSGANLVSFNEELRSTIFYNRSHPKFGGAFMYQRNRRKSILLGGFDSTSTNSLWAMWRWNISPHLTAKLEGGQKLQTSESDFMTSNRFNITSQEIQPGLMFLPSRQIRLGLSGHLKQKNNGFGDERIVMQEVGIDFRSSRISKRMIDGKLDFVTIHTNQEDLFNATVVGYQMMEGLRQGNNFKWRLSLTQQLTNGLQLTFNYDGRKPNDSRIVHLGSLRISALF